MKLAMAVMVAVVWVGGAFGQSTAGFQVASIKPNHTGDSGSSWNISPGEMVMRNVTLKQLVQIAYDVKDYSMAGPDWLGSARFDINAKTPAEVAAEKDPQRRDALFRGAMQGLMAERFKLAVHRETKTMGGYALVVAKGGLKMKPVADEGGWNENSKNGTLTVTRLSMERMCVWLAQRLDRPVMDKTETKGVFSFRLEFSPEQRLSAAAPGEGTAAAEHLGPSIFTALQEQLGLRLQSQQVPVEMVVVDAVERVPTEN